MTKQIKSLKQQFKDWRKKVKKREREDELETAKETILFNLTDGLTTQESIEMYLEIKDKYNQLMQERLLRVSEEKVALEQFLSV